MEKIYKFMECSFCGRPAEKYFDASKNDLYCAVCEPEQTYLFCEVCGGCSSEADFLFYQCGQSILCEECKE